MNVLSLFDGISCGRVALERVGIKVTNYHACEIDKHATKVSQKNYPDIVRHGSVIGYRPDRFFHYLIGGSPCQGFSFAGDQKAFNDPRSALFWEFVRILAECKKINPKIKFLLENVKMKKEHLDVISAVLGVQPVCINSSLVSAQNRVRYYWFNWSVEQPADRGIFLRDIIDDNYSKDDVVNEGQLNRLLNSTDVPKRFSKIDPKKAGCLTARMYANWKGTFITIPLSNWTPPYTDSHDPRKIIGVAVTPGGLRPFKNDGRKGSLSEIGTINLEGGKSSAVIATHPPKILLDHTCDKITYRKLTPIECERLQTLEDNYTDAVPTSHRYKQLGNGWNVETVAHILEGSK